MASDNGLSPGQCWNIVNWTLGTNFNIFIQENVFENVVWKMAAILFRSQCVKAHIIHWQWVRAWLYAKHRSIVRNAVTPISILTFVDDWECIIIVRGLVTIKWYIRNFYINMSRVDFYLRKHESSFDFYISSGRRWSQYFECRYGYITLTILWLLVTWSQFANLD